MGVLGIWLWIYLCFAVGLIVADRYFGVLRGLVFVDLMTLVVCVVVVLI